MNDNADLVDLERPRVPLCLLPFASCHGINEDEYRKLQGIYKALKEECEALSKISSEGVEGASVILSDTVVHCTVEQYNARLSAYKKAREQYVLNNSQNLETIEMVRGKLKILYREQEMSPEVEELPDPPESPDIDLLFSEKQSDKDEYNRLYAIYERESELWHEKLRKNFEHSKKDARICCEIFDEVSKFPELSEQYDRAFNEVMSQS